MSNLLTQARAIRDAEQNESTTKKHEAATKTLLDVALRDIAGKAEESDARELADALDALGVTDEYYAEMLKAIPLAAKAEADLQYFTEKLEAAPGKHKEYASIKAMRDFEVAIAKHEFDACGVDWQTMTTRKQIEMLTSKFPHLYQARPGAAFPEPKFFTDRIPEHLAKHREREYDALMRVAERADRAANPLLRQAGHEHVNTPQVPESAE